MPLFPILSDDEIADKPKQWPVLEHRVKQRGQILNLVEDEIQATPGKSYRREYTTHFGAVGILAVDEHNRVVVLRQYRHPASQEFIEIPAGLLDSAAEDSLAAAKRELAEEAMLAASDWRILVDAFASPGCSDEQFRIYLARGLTPVPRPTGFLLEAEEAEMTVALAELTDLVAAVYAGKLQSPTLVMAVLAASDLSRWDDLRPATAAWPSRDNLANRGGDGFLV